MLLYCGNWGRLLAVLFFVVTNFFSHSFTCALGEEVHTTKRGEEYKALPLQENIRNISLKNIDLEDQRHISIEKIERYSAPKISNRYKPGEPAPSDNEAASLNRLSLLKFTKSTSITSIYDCISVEILPDVGNFFENKCNKRINIAYSVAGNGACTKYACAISVDPGYLSRIDIQSTRHYQAILCTAPEYPVQWNRAAGTYRCVNPRQYADTTGLESESDGRPLIIYPAPFPERCRRNMANLVGYGISFDVNEYGAVANASIAQRVEENSCFDDSVYAALGNWHFTKRFKDGFVAFWFPKELAGTFVDSNFFATGQPSNNNPPPRYADPQSDPDDDFERELVIRKQCREARSSCVARCSSDFGCIDRCTRAEYRCRRNGGNYDGGGYTPAPPPSSPRSSAVEASQCVTVEPAESDPGLILTNRCNYRVWAAVQMLSPSGSIVKRDAGFLVPSLGKFINFGFQPVRTFRGSSRPWKAVAYRNTDTLDDGRDNNPARSAARRAIGL